MGKATGWGDFQKNWHLEHPKAQLNSLVKTGLFPGEAGKNKRLYCLIY